MKVPRQLAVVVGDSDKCKYPDIVDPAFFKTCSRTEKLALVLLCEKSLGDDSKVCCMMPGLRLLLRLSERTCSLRACNCRCQHVLQHAYPNNRICM